MNNKEKIKKDINELNEILHGKNIPEANRSQFIGLLLLYLKNITKNKNIVIEKYLSEIDILKDIKSTLASILKNKKDTLKILNEKTFEKNSIKELKNSDYKEILTYLLKNILTFMNKNEEGQDLLNLFFITFNKYTEKNNKNQVFTPDHITDFICEILNVDKTKKVLDSTCGSGAFLVQAINHELTDCKNEEESNNVKRNNIYGIEIEETAFSLATINMLIYGDGNSNIKLGSLFDSEEFIKNIEPDIILMNPPYNAPSISIPNKYKEGWSKSTKEDPTKGLMFVEFMANCIKTKEAKLAVILPISCAIASNKIMKKSKSNLLKNNTLEAVFTLAEDLFYPSASVNTCCMIFTLNKPHSENKETFFGYFKDDGFKKKKNLGRVEQFDKNGKSIWKSTKENWIDLYTNKKVVDGLSAIQVVTAEDEWLCEAYMNTDYSKLTQDDFQQTLNNYLSYLVKEGKIFNE